MTVIESNGLMQSPLFFMESYLDIVLHGDIMGYGKYAFHGKGWYLEKQTGGNPQS